MLSEPWPIELADIERARARIGDRLSPTPLRHYPLLDELVGHGVRVWVKHENHQPTCAFKVRNGLSAVSALSEAERERGVVAATRGNHGQGLAFAGRALGAEVTICVPLGNSPAKNAAMRALGAEVIERGRDYDEAVEVAERLVTERGLTLIHSTNNPHILAGAGTIALEMIEQQPQLDALVIAVGGGSQAVGALTVMRALSPETKIYGVQAAGASASHDGYHRGEPVSLDTAETFADGLATRNCYAMTFPTLCAGLHDFITVTDEEIAAAVRAYISRTHNLAEGAGAAGLAGVMQLAPKLAGQSVGVILSGGNLDQNVLLQVLTP